MRKIVFVTAMAFGLIGAQAAARAQDEEPAADPAADPTAEPAGDGTEGTDGTGEAGGEAGGGMEEGDGGGDMAMAPAPKMRLGGALAVVLPIGDWADFTGIGIGVLGRFAYMVSPKLAILAQPGYIHHLEKDMFSTREMVLLLGARFMVTPEIAIGGDTGYVSAKGCFDGTCGDSQGRIPLNIAAEYQMSSGLYAGASLFITNLLLKDSDLDEKTFMGIMANVGYTIGL